ncbi:hypothetical protein Tco_1524056 [Tanacetum coccineum]
MTNQEMLDSKAYKEYYVVASGVEPPKAKTKYKKKADEPVTPSKSKTAPASKGSRLKSPAKVAKTDKKKQHATMQKTKGLVVLSEVALTEAEQIKLATKRSKTQFHNSHASGSGDGVDTQSKLLLVEGLSIMSTQCFIIVALELSKEANSLQAEDLEEEPTPTGDQSGPSALLAPKTAKQLTGRRNHERVKSILLLAIPDEYLLKFHNVA